MPRTQWLKLLKCEYLSSIVVNGIPLGFGLLAKENKPLDANKIIVTYIFKLFPDMSQTKQFSNLENNRQVNSS